MLKGVKADIDEKNFTLNVLKSVFRILIVCRVRTACLNKNIDTRI